MNGKKAIKRTAIGIDKLSLAKTAVSFITNPTTVPFRVLFAKEVPADGKAVCEEAWRMELTTEETPDL
jgi:hypothetical protein